MVIKHLHAATVGLISVVRAAVQAQLIQSVPSVLADI